MFKKLLVASAILATSSTAVLADGAPYLGASVGIVDNTASGGNFRGAPLTINAGYGAKVNQTAYLAGEVFSTVGTATLSSNSTFNTLKTTYGYGASFIPGILLSDRTMAYGRLGLVKTRFSQYNRTVTGGQVGLGLQTSVTQNWDLRGEYTYTDYQKFRGVSPQADAFNVGLVYKFE